MILGLVGTNGIGKTTALKILSGKMKPNLGEFDQKPSWDDILRHYRGTELQGYFKKIVEDNLTVSIKPQYINLFIKEAKRLKKGFTVKKYLRKNDMLDNSLELCKVLSMTALMDRNVSDLSGGELQRLLLIKTASQEADMYMFDEPSSYLDVSQRLAASTVVRGCLYTDKHYVIVVEHDLAVLDFLSDFICVLFGQPAGYGIVSTPSSVREGINNFLSGFIPTENVRFREFQLDFKLSQTQYAPKSSRKKDNRRRREFSNMSKTFYDREEKTKEVFKLSVDAGTFSNPEIIVLLGENGTGKTTLIQMLAGKMETDSECEIPEIAISFKPQTIQPKFKGTVMQLFMRRIRDSFNHPQFQTDVYKPLDIDHLSDRKVRSLSGGELQRVAICLALGTPADVYFLDEPSAFLDALQRIKCAKIIKRFIFNAKKTAFIVEHDFIMATYLADRVIVFDGQPGIDCHASSPIPLLEGMNSFLKSLQITFRREPKNFRPRINKLHSVKDREQKQMGAYFFQNSGVADDDEDDKLQAYFKKVGSGKKEKDKKRDEKRTRVKQKKKKEYIKKKHEKAAAEKLKRKLEDKKMKEDDKEDDD